MATSCKAMTRINDANSGKADGKRLHSCPRQVWDGTEEVLFWSESSSRRRPLTAKQPPVGWRMAWDVREPA